MIILSFDVPYLKLFQENAIMVLFGFMGMGFIAYAFDNKTFILLGFACAAALALFLKSASSNNLKLPDVNNNVKIAAAHVNVSSVESSYENLINELNSRSLDIVSFQEVKPDWSMYFKKELQDSFPYFIENVRIDPFGMAIYSKYPLKSVDTIFFEDIPFLVSEIQLDEERSATILNTMLMPSINSRLDKTQEKQLKYVGEYLSQKEGTELVLGDFNMVYWSNRITDFRSKTKMLNSRRDVSQSVLSIPYDHIFHSKDLECTMFRDMVDSSGVRFGIQGNFQFLDNKQAKI